MKTSKLGRVIAMLLCLVMLAGQLGMTNVEEEYDPDHEYAEEAASESTTAPVAPEASVPAAEETNDSETLTDSQLTAGGVSEENQTPAENEPDDMTQTPAEAETESSAETETPAADETQEEETPAESDTSAQAPAAPSQEAAASAEPAAIAADVPLAASTLSGRVSLSYSQRAGTTGETTNRASIYLVDGQWDNGYKVTLKTPDKPDGEDITNRLTTSGSTNKTRFFTLVPTKGGDYSVEITKDGTEGSITATMKIYKVTFHTGEGGQFPDGQKEATGYGDKYSFFYQYAIPQVKATGDSTVFQGWSTVEGGSGTTFNRVSEKKELLEDTDINLYAVYGTPKKYSFQLMVNGQELNDRDTYDFGAKDIGYKPEPATFKFENTGNQPITIGRRSSDGNFIIEMDSSFTVAAGDHKDITVTPKAGLGAGVHEQTFQIRFDETATIYTYTLKFQVNSGNVIITPPTATHKPYGTAWTQDNLEITAKAERKDGGVVDYKSLGLTLECAGFSADAPVTTEGYSYSLQPSNSLNFTAKLAAGDFKLIVDPVDPVGTATAGQVFVGQKLSTASLSGSFHHQDHSDWTVNGTLEWVNAEKEMTTAGTFQETWTFKPDNGNYNTITGETEVVVSDLKETVVTDPAVTVFEYNGRNQPVAFTATRDDEQVSAGDINVWYRPYGSTGDEGWTQTAPVNAGTYEVKAEVQASGAYAAGYGDAVMTINKRIVKLYYKAMPKEYDGTTDVKSDHGAPEVRVTNALAGDKVGVEFTCAFDSKDAGNNRVVVFHLVKLTGDGADNYDLPANRELHFSAKIGKRGVSIKGDIAREYGQPMALTADMFTVTELAKGDTVADLGAVFTCAGLSATSDAGSYPITVTLNSQNYQLKYLTGGVRDSSVGDLTVNKATPVLRSPVTAGLAQKGCHLSDVTLSGEFVNPHDHNMVVGGTFKWAADNADSLPKDQNTYEAHWVFEMDPAYEGNYNAPEDGTVTIDLLNRHPLHMSVDAQTVPYNGKAQAFTSYEFTEEKPAAVSVLYRKHYDMARTIALFSVGDDWTPEEPVDAGVYDVQITGTPWPTSEYGENTMETVFTITPVAPNVQGEQNLTVPEGTSLSDKSVANMLKAPTGLNGQPLAGTFTWTTPNAVITEDGEKFQWVFAPNDPNYTSAYGTATFTLKADARTISATVYNLPDDLGYLDYAVVDVTKSGLKEGDVVTFYENEDCANPESEPTVVTQADIVAGKLTVNLDADALDDMDGVIYARITSVKKNAPSALTYGAEPSVTLLENGIVCDDGEIDLPNGGGSCTVSVILQGEGYTIEKTEYSLNQSGSTFTITPEGKLTSKSSGEATLTATVTLNHPDPAKAQAGETIVLTVQAKVVCHGVVKDKVQSDTVLSGGLVGGSSLLESVMTPEEIAEAEKSGAVVDVVLSMKAVDESSVFDSDKSAVASAAGAAGYDVGQYMKIDLSKLTISTEGKSEVPITEIKKPLTIQVRVPSSLSMKLGNLWLWDFAVIRLHDGEATVLHDQDSDPNTVTFATDKFSTYALAYKKDTRSLTIVNQVMTNDNSLSSEEQRIGYELTLQDAKTGEPYNGTVYAVFNDDATTKRELALKDGKASFELGPDEFVTISDAPRGIKYIISEIVGPCYVPAQLSATGILNDDAQVIFVNTRYIWNITFDCNGGDIAGQKITTAQTGPSGALGGGFPTPKKEGSSFIGWYTARQGGDKVTVDTVFSQDTTVFAHWSESVIPPTGDTSDPGLWAALLGASAMAACACVSALIRRKRKN